MRRSSGTRTPGLKTQKVAAPATAQKAKKSRKRTVPIRLADGSAEGNEPRGIEPEVHPVAVHERVGEERRHRRDVATRQHLGEARHSAPG